MARLFAQRDLLIVEHQQKYLIDVENVIIEEHVAAVQSTVFIVVKDYNLEDFQ